MKLRAKVGQSNFMNLVYRHFDDFSLESFEVPNVCSDPSETQILSFTADERLMKLEEPRKFFEI